MLCSSHKGLSTAEPSYWLNLEVGEADLVVQILFAVLNFFSHAMGSSQPAPHTETGDNPCLAGRPQYLYIKAFLDKFISKD